MEKLISVIIATYNGEKYIKEQLDSILNQTYQNIEIVICDDCSIDSTVSIVKSYLEKYSNIRMYVNEENMGYNKTFEKLVTLCKSDYIAVSDQDDIWKPNKLEMLMVNIENNEVICSKKIDINNEKKLLPDIHFRSFEFAKRLQYDDLNFLNLYFVNILWGCTSLAKKSFLMSCIPFPEQKYFCYDHWICLNAFVANSLKYIDEITIYHRVHSNNVTRNNNLQNPYKRWLKNISSKNLTENYKTEIQKINLVLNIQSLPVSYKNIMQHLKDIYSSIVLHKLNMKYIILFIQELILYKKINRRFVFILKSIIERLVLFVI